MTYPAQRAGTMLKSGPTDPDLVVSGGTLLYHPNRDERFPYLYAVPRHSLADKIKNQDAVKHIIVYIQDTSPVALQSACIFEDTLHVPLGPNDTMGDLGLFHLQDGTIIYARAKGMKTDKEDIIVAWNYLGSRLNKKAASDLLNLREEVLGDEESMTLTPPRIVDGELQGGTYFERLGQKGVKGTRCYSLGLTHQSQRRLVGPTAGGKVFNGEFTENERLRKRITEVNTNLAMESLITFAPPDFLAVLAENSEANNIPKIGTSNNVAYPAVQLNISPAVPFSECRTQGLQGMGEFGSTEGHRDGKDSEGGLTCMIANSRLPSNYESGRFHLLRLGVFITLEHTMTVNFCGLNLHGGSPPIAPEGEEVAQHAYRMMCVCYPPSSMLSNAYPQVAPLASLPNGTLLVLGPEITNPLGQFGGERYSNEACWTIDGGVVMNKFDHFQHVSRLTLQLVSYILGQLPDTYGCQLDSDKFFGAITIAADSAAVSESSNRITAGTWTRAPEKIASDVGLRQYRSMNWQEHCRKRAQFIPAKYNYVEAADPTDADHSIESIRAFRPKTFKGPKRAALDEDFSNMSKPKKRQKIHRLQEVVSNLNAVVMDSSLCEVAPTLEQAAVNTDSDGDISLEMVDLSDRSNLENDQPNMNEIVWSVNSIERFNVQMEDGESERGESRHESSEPTPERLSSALSIADIILKCKNPDLEEESENVETDLEKRNGISSFLSTLNHDAISSAIGDYRKAWAIRKENHSLTDLESATNLCGSAIQTVKMHPHSAETANAIGGIWKSLESVRKSHSLSKISAHATEAILMLSIYTMFSWIAQVVGEAMNATKAGVSLENSEDSTWVMKLVLDIRSEIQRQHHHRRITRSGTTVRSSEATLYAKTYLPNLSPKSPQFSFAIPRLYITNTAKMDDNIERIAINAIRTWMNFPIASEAEVQSSLIASLMECGRVSILFLEPVRRMFQYPYRTVINGPNSGQRRSKPHTRKILAEFYYAFQDHDMMNPESAIYSELEELEVMISRCSVLPKLAQPSWSQISAPKLTPLIERPTVLEQLELEGPGKGKRRFVEFLENCFPLVQDGLSLESNFSEPLLAKIAEKPDFFLPFRSLSPTVSKARKTILADPARLATREGLFNILAFRGVFYGSPFARDDLRWFDSYEDWLSFEADNRSKGESYFVCKMAYGSAQSARETRNLKQYWDKGEEWIIFQQENPYLDPLKLHDFFRAKFRNIGNLTALLIIGDLAETKFIPEPSADAIGKLVSITKMGALKTMEYLDLIENSASRTKVEVAKAFEELDQYCRRMLDTEKQVAMKYSTITLENALCKYSRITGLRRAKTAKPIINRGKSGKKGKKNHL